MMSEYICLDKQYSTTRMVVTEKPVLEKKEGDKFETLLFLPEGEGRKGEGGLRTRGCFKKSLPDKPLITVITVVFNGEKYLEETILSVISQTYDNVEYIIVDGGSTDGTLDIVRKYEGQIDYWVSEKDGGIYDAMNKGIGLSSGELVALLNADDFYDDKYIIKNIIKKYHNDKFIATDAKILTDSGIRLFKVNIARNIAHNIPFIHTATLIPMRIYKRIGLYSLDYKIASDIEFIIRMRLGNIAYILFDSPLIVMREGGVSDKQFILGRIEYRDIIIRYYKRTFSASFWFFYSVLEKFLYNRKILRNYYRKYLKRS